MENKGVIYILTNPSFPDYVKIGYADDIDKRLKQLNRSECIPFAFRVYATYEVNSRLSDLKLHSIIDKLNLDLRSIDDFNGQKRVREFYAMNQKKHLQYWRQWLKYMTARTSSNLLHQMKQKKKKKNWHRKLIQKVMKKLRIFLFLNVRYRLVQNWNIMLIQV